MVGGMYFLPEDKFDGIEVHVIEFPRGILAGAEGFYYWENIDSGEGPDPA